MPGMQPGLRLDEWQVETIKRVWMLTGNQREAARQAGCSSASATRYVNLYREELEALRTQKQPELIEVIEALLGRVLSVAFDEKKLQEASLRDLGVVAGILIDKRQLLSGGATERVQTIPPNIEVMLTPEEKVAMASIRKKLEAEVARRDSDDDQNSPWMRDVIDVESRPVEVTNGHEPQPQQQEKTSGWMVGAGQVQEPLDPALPPQLIAAVQELRDDKAALEQRVRDGTATHAQRLRLSEVERLLKRKEEQRQTWLEDWRKRQEKSQ